MYPKKKVQQLVEAVAGHFIQMLRLESIKIDFYVDSSKNLADVKSGYGDLAGLTRFTYNTNLEVTGAEIFIFSDFCYTKQEAMDTLIHELFHVKFRAIDKCIKQSKLKQASNIEEEIVRTTATLAAKLINTRMINKLKNI